MTPEWYEEDPKRALAWAAEFLVTDLQEIARNLRKEAEWLNDKAALLRDILEAATAENDKSPPA